MIRKIDVFASGNKVGTLALTNDNRVAFQYTDEWVENGFSINPFKLPLSKQLFYATSPHFNGLFGVFADSLPDSYGELLLDRFLRSKNMNANELTCLDRLAYVGSSGMGLLEYVPDLSVETDRSNIDFDLIQKECNDLLDSKEVDNINELYSLGGSSGGARPKSLIEYEGEDYIVKFSSRFDPKNIAELEYKYMSLARESGINVPKIKLITTKKGNKYFLIKRFDRVGHKKVHMISAAALLEVDFRAPSLDYNELIKLTRVLTKNDDDVVEMYRRMVFNVLIDNQDDHTKNFSFIYDDVNGTYRLSPAYDITPGRTYYGEHTTSVNGKGKNITDEDMIKVALNNKIDVTIAQSIINEIKDIVK
ncbi:MAG: type II toxin-antitoxin system HipA family toxin [Bacilli bacterium]|nr:type II toxin-antitoxin system HipA family toxin [Bacilli bacterium]MBO4682494.1 type II toxin-antitoxin system HipA family toxin [Bacilli bacterium]